MTSQMCAGFHLQVTRRGRADFPIADHHGEQWLLLDHHNPRVLIFVCPLQRDLMYSSSVLLSDGSFKICPRGFAQIYDVHSEVNGEPVKLCTILMENRFV